jgi:broad specificity phosphatase PhoE
VDPAYPSKTQQFAFTRSAVLGRGQVALKSLRARPEKVIAVVSHAGFLRCGISRRHFNNADYRIFEFEEDGGVEVKLRELPETEVPGGGMGSSFLGIAEIEEHDFPKDVQEVPVPETKSDEHIPSQEP